MPRQNRVTPFGDIVAIPERGTFLGNRGILHDADCRVKRAWQAKRWLVCVLEFRGRKRTVMAPNRYTELFFLDEATALAAGHRPCAECRHRRFLDFCRAWQAALAPGIDSPRPRADVIDAVLHTERLCPDRSKRSYTAALENLPDGALIAQADRAAPAYLLWRGRLHEWSAAGYRPGRPRPTREIVHVLTPPSTVAAIRAGYVPDVHPSANR